MQAQKQGHSSIGGLLREAHRRRVFRVAALYIVGAWLVLQVADVLFPAFGIPEAAIQALVLAAVVGFPVAMVFAWMFDVGRHGIRRTAKGTQGAAAGPVRLQRADYVLLLAFTAVAMVIVYNAVQEVRRAPRAPLGVETVASGFDPLPKLANSIAVLPFTNISNDPANAFFADGISEEILHRLAAFGALNVIGRTSSFAFKGSDYPVPKLSALLGTRYLLQGSVRKAGDQVRIAAQLLDDAGVQIWSQTFDRELRDVFAIQSEIADAVAKRVAPQISPLPTPQDLPDIEAYEHYLAGREMLHSRQVNDAREAFERAIEIDPDFAEAFAELAITYAIGAPDEVEIQAARQAIDTALSLRPDLLRAHAALGLVLQAQRPPDFAGSEATLRGVLARDSTMSDALNWYAAALSGQDRDAEADAVWERGARIDPLHPALAGNWADRLWKRGEAGRAEGVLLRLLESPQRQSPYPYLQLRDFYLGAGRLVDMNRIVKRQALEGAASNYFGLALNYALFGDWASAKYWAMRSRRDFPNHGYSTFYGLLPPLWRGQYREAQKAFELTLANREVRLEEMDLSFTNWLTIVQALAGDFRAAIATLEPVMDEGPENELLGFEALHALAWAYLQAGESDKAKPVLTDLDRRYRELDEQGTLHLGQRSVLAEDPYLYALNTLMMGKPELALDRLEAAVEAGWRNYYISHHDPRWEPVRDHPRFQKLMAKVKAGVDAQYAEVRQMDAEDDFIARLDAIMATPVEASTP